MVKIKFASVALLSVALGACGGEAAAPPPPAGPPIDVTAKELAQAYEDNEAAAQAKFGSSALNVTGIINSIDLDFADEPYLVLRGTNQFMGPQAKLDEAGQKQASTLKKGQTIKLRCTKISELGGTPMLDNCAIQP